MSHFTPRLVTHLSLLILLGFAVQISGCATDSNAAKGAEKARLPVRWLVLSVAWLRR